MILESAMTQSALLATQIGLGLIFAYSSIMKLLSPSQFVKGVERYSVVSPNFAGLVAGLVIAFELVAAVAHLLGWMLQTLIPFVSLTLAVFLVVIILFLRRGARVPCLCFGARSEEEVSVSTTVRLAILICAELVLYVSIYMDFHDPFIYLLPASELFAGTTAAFSGILVIMWIMRLPDCWNLHRTLRNLCEKLPST